MYGKADADRYVGEVTMSYLLDTCPGSSGCNVVSIITEGNGKRVIHYVPHSQGRRQGGGLSGGGVTYALSL